MSGPNPKNSSNPGDREREPVPAPGSLQGSGAVGSSSMHQPPNPIDLERNPPTSPICARVRGLLRDYVDSDLGVALARLVEDHAHHCRSCSVELSRAEHEVLQLRRAYLPERAAEVAPRAGFVARVLERLIDGDGSGVTGSATDSGVTDSSSSDSSSSDSSVHRRGAGVPGGETEGGETGAQIPMRFGSRADVKPSLISRHPRQAVREQKERDQGRRVRELDFALSSPAGMLVAGLFFLFLLGAGMRLFSGAEASFDNAAKLVVTWANDAFDGDLQPLEIGASLGDRGKLLVGAQGLARVDWRDPSTHTQPAASLTLQGGEVRLEGGEPLLVEGRLEILAKRNVEIPMIDGTRIGLGSGEYIVAAEIPSDLEFGGDWEPPYDPLGSLPGSLRVSVQVLRGDPARISRADGVVVLVAKGSTGIYAGGGVVEVQSSGPVAVVDRSPQPTPLGSVPAKPRLSGMALEASGLPTVQASVFLSAVIDNSVQHGAAITDSTGRFLIETLAPCQRDFAIALALPDQSRSDLGLVPPQAMPLLRQGSSAQLSRPIRFDVSVPLSASVVDEDGSPVAGVLVVPCVVDELFGTVLALSAQRGFTDAQGAFQIYRLPARLPAHQRLVVLLSHLSFDATCLPVPVRGGAGATVTMGPMRIRSLREVGFVGLPPNSTQTIFQEVPGLPSGSVAVRRQVTTDFFGRVMSATFGVGRMWLREGTPNQAELRTLEVDSGQGSGGGGLPRFRPKGAATQFGKLFRPLESLTDSLIQVANSYRHQTLLADQGENAVSGPVLRVVDGQGHPVPEAQVFAVRATGPRSSLDLRFLGFTQASGIVSLGGVAVDENVVAIGPNAALGWLAMPLLMANATVQLQPTGSVLVGANLRPGPSEIDRAVTVQLERIGGDLLPGMTPVIVRFAHDHNEWQISDVPAGEYQVTMGETVVEINVPPLGWFVLQ